MYIFGACEYQDVFEGTTLHVTKCCFEVEVAFDPLIPINPNNAETRCLCFKAASQHNAADWA